MGCDTTIHASPARCRKPAKAETVPGMRARSLVDDLLAEARHKVRCEPIEWDGYCRVVATCTTAVDLTSASNIALTMAALQYVKPE